MRRGAAKPATPPAPANDDRKSAIVTARRPRARSSAEVPDMTPEEHGGEARPPPRSGGNWYAGSPASREADIPTGEYRHLTFEPSEHPQQEPAGRRCQRRLPTHCGLSPHICGRRPRSNGSFSSSHAARNSQSGPPSRSTPWPAPRVAIMLPKLSYRVLPARRWTTATMERDRLSISGRCQERGANGRVTTLFVISLRVFP